ncbi:MAG: peptidylprolyl isomerase [Sandaracinaceae bacterium]
MRRILLSLLALALLVSSDLPGRAQDPAGAESPAEAEARRRAVLARVGEATVTVGMVEDALAERSHRPASREALRAEATQIAERMLAFELLAREAQRRGYGDHPETLRATRRHAVEQMIRRDFDESMRGEDIPPADIEAYYRAHLDDFRRPELRRAQHILVASREEAEQRLREARDADARTFRQLARDHSLDPESRLRDGDLRYFDERGRLRDPSAPRIHPSLVSAAFGLEEEGTIVEAPVAVDDRWSVLKLVDVIPAEERSLQDATSSIRARLLRERRRTEFETFVRRLREEARVEVHPDRMRPIRLDVPSVEGAAQVPPGPPTETRGAGGGDDEPPSSEGEESPSPAPEAPERGGE